MAGKPIPEGWTVISRFIQPGAQLFHDPETQRLVLKNIFGHCRMITDGQWADMIVQGDICRCGQCVLCGVLDMTLNMIEEPETVGILDNPEIDILLDVIQERVRDEE